MADVLMALVSQERASERRVSYGFLKCVQAQDATFLCPVPRMLVSLCFLLLLVKLRGVLREAFPWTCLLLCPPDPGRHLGILI